MEERRRYPRMKNKGIVKKSYIVINEADHEDLLELEILNTSKEGLKVSLQNPGKFRYDIGEDLPVKLKVIFNNEISINVDAKVIWYKDFPDKLEFGLNFSGTIW